MVRTVVAVFVLALAGCAAEQPRLVFEKAGTPDAQLKKDQRACLRAAISGDDAIVSNLLKIDRDAYMRCMQTRGYTIRTQS
jgi:hypothetical protein